MDGIMNMLSRSFLRAGSAATICIVWWASAMGQSFDGTWRGEMNCAKLSFAKGPQKVPVEVTVVGNSATFSRKVWNQDNSAVVGTEEGKGEVAANGAIKFAAVWKSSALNPKCTYTASYAGTLTSSLGRLQGTQAWSFDRKTETRACSIMLKK